MVVIETLSKMLQLGDQRLCQIGRRIKGLKNGDINKQHILSYGQGSLEVNLNILIGSFSLTVFYDRDRVHGNSERPCIILLFSKVRL